MNAVKCSRLLWPISGGLALLILLSLVRGTAAQTITQQPAARYVEVLPVPAIPYAPRHYVCYRTSQGLKVDGRLDEVSWQQADWTESFVDIEGNLKPNPRYGTRAKLLWDSTYFYVGAELEEPDVWATLTKRDAVIYHDNDFEVFIDPDMDTHEYYELELNALNTVWDLLLLKPYRDGGPAVNAWDIQGLQTAVAVNGTLNRPDDTDSGWSVEIAIPWVVLSECAHRPSPPQNGDQWKVNFSRVEWRTEVRDGAYVKLRDASTGTWLPENNWVWSPQGLIAMHYPEMWGTVQFTMVESGARPVEFVTAGADSARWALRRVFYAERDHFTLNGRYTADLAELGIDPITLRDFAWPPSIQTTAVSFDAELTSGDGRIRLRIREDGRVTEEVR